MLLLSSTVVVRVSTDPTVEYSFSSWLPQTSAAGPSSELLFSPLYWTAFAHLPLRAPYAQEMQGSGLMSRVPAVSPLPMGWTSLSWRVLPPRRLERWAQPLWPLASPAQPSSDGSNGLQALSSHHPDAACLWYGPELEVCYSSALKRTLYLDAWFEAGNITLKGTETLKCLSLCEERSAFCTVSSPATAQPSS